MSTVSVYGSVFTKIYDPFLALGERAGMRELRRSVVADATGAVLEIGAGTGLNLPLYPPSVKDLTLADPEPSMAARLREVAAADARQPVVVQTGAESLPFADDSFDTVVSTLVLCTVDDVAASLAEIRRVLRPGGRLLLIEHVRGEDGGTLAQWQDRLHGPWKAFGYGCNCNRDTRMLLDRAGFRTAALEPGRWPRMVPLVAPLIVGTATPAG